MRGAKPAGSALGRSRRRLTLLVTLLTCTVLGASLYAGWALSQKQLTAAGEAAFTSQCAELCQRVAGGSLNDAWLAQWEAQNRYVAGLSDNGRTPFFQGGWQPQTGRQVLLERARAAVEADDDLIATALWAVAAPFTVKGDFGETYRAFAASVPMARGSCQVLVLQDLRGEQAALRAAAWRYLGLFAGGGLALAVVSLVMSQAALAPVRRAMERQAQFVSAAGHELRTPVAAVRASLDAMEACPKQADSYREAARAETARLGRLVEDLLTLANADAARWKWQPRLLDTDAVLSDAAEQLRGLAAQRGFRLELDLPDAMLPPVRGDADRLIQLLAVLVDNATSYAPAGQPVTLRAQAAKGAVCIAVEDHGPGVPDADKQRIFTRFARGDESRAGAGHFGLGLAVARELAALHGGQLLCTDTPGGGATFTLALPIAKKAK